MLGNSLPQMRKGIRVITRVSLVGSLSFFFLFSGSSVLRNWSVSAGCLHETEAIFRDPGMQWMVLLCLAVYGATFLFLRRSKIGRSSLGSRRGDEADDRGRQQVPPSHVGGYGDSSTVWLIGFLGVGVLAYSLDYSVASKSIQALMLVGTATLGLGAGVLKSGKRNYLRNAPLWQAAESGNGITAVVVVVLLAVASFWQSEIRRAFEYRGNSSWVGPWDNPNTFGVLMGVGCVLAVGCAMRGWFGFKESRVENRRWKIVLRTMLCLAAAGFMGRGLYHSLSRGAWVATGCGIGYLVYQVIRCQVSGGERAWGVGRQVRMADGGMDDGTTEAVNSRISWFHKNWLALSVVFLSVVVLAMWHLRQTEWRPARRAISVANANDFSWRNRVAAWEGTLQMMAEQPWWGVGWNQPEPMYENYYLLPRLEESAAIQMNDYLMLGATLGIPALFCFGMYLWLSLLEIPNSKLRVPSSKQPSSILDPRSSQWLSATCRAGAIVLLVGFWFDGGLFKLATASTFWILLELGRTDVNRRGAEAQSSV
ncbi:MAG: O-antigen ligase family protein [Verrucomicrobiota bacterium]